MRILILFILLCCTMPAMAQTFFVSGNDSRSREHVINKIKFEGYKVTTDSLAADYIVQLLIDGQYKVVSFKRAYQGYIKVFENKTGNEVARTKVVKRNPAVLNGYNAAEDIFSTIAKKYLVDAIRKCTTLTSKS